MNDDTIYRITRKTTSSLQGRVEEMITLGEFWSKNHVTQIFLVSTDAPTGYSLFQDHDPEDPEDYCDLAECLNAGLIMTPAADLFAGHKDLTGNVSDDGRCWTWDGTGKVWDSNGSDILKIQLVSTAGQAARKSNTGETK